MVMNHYLLQIIPINMLRVEQQTLKINKDAKTATITINPKVKIGLMDNL